MEPLLPILGIVGVVVLARWVAGRNRAEIQDLFSGLGHPRGALVTSSKLQALSCKAAFAPGPVGLWRVSEERFLTADPTDFDFAVVDWKNTSRSFREGLDGDRDAPLVIVVPRRHHGGIRRQIASDRPTLVRPTPFFADLPEAVSRALRSQEASPREDS